MAPLYREKAQLILVKIESVSGTDSVPTTANCVRSKGVPEITVDYMDSGDRGDVQTGILSAADDAAPSGRYGKFDITVELKGAGNAYSSSVLPEADALWRASGFSQAVGGGVGAEQVFYTTLDTAMETVTAYVYAGGKLFKLVGCVAQPKLAAEVYKAATATFTVTGKLVADPTEVAVPAPSFQIEPPPSFHSALASLVAAGPGVNFLSSDATNPFMLTAVSIDMGTVIADLPSAGASDGLVAWAITDRAPTQDLTFFVPALSAFDPFAMSRLDGNQGKFITSFQVGTVIYRKILFSTRWHPRAPKFANRSGAKQYSISGPLRVGGGLPQGREIEITYK